MKLFNEIKTSVKLFTLLEIFHFILKSCFHQSRNVPFDTSLRLVLSKPFFKFDLVTIIKTFLCIFMFCLHNLSKKKYRKLNLIQIYIRFLSHSFFNFTFNVSGAQLSSRCLWIDGSSSNPCRNWNQGTSRP